MKTYLFVVNASNFFKWLDILSPRYKPFKLKLLNIQSNLSNQETNT